MADLQELLCEDGVQPLRDLNDAYIRMSATRISAMRAAFTRRDSGTLADAAHALRGSSATVGAQRVMQVCAVIEDRARAGAIAGLDDLLNTVEQEVSAFKDAVAPLLGPSSK